MLMRLNGPLDVRVRKDVWNVKADKDMKTNKHTLKNAAFLWKIRQKILLLVVRTPMAMDGMEVTLKLMEKTIAISFQLV